MAIRRRKRLFGMRRRIGKSLVPPTQARLRVAVRLVETGGGVARPNRISRRERHYIEGGLPPEEWRVRGTVKLARGRLRRGGSRLPAGHDAADHALLRRRFCQRSRQQVSPVPS